MATPDFNPDDLQLRCRSSIHGIVKNGLLEVKCKHWYCTRGNAITFHYFDLETGELVETKQYKDPNKEKNT